MKTQIFLLSLMVLTGNAVAADIKLVDGRVVEEVVIPAKEEEVKQTELNLEQLEADSFLHYTQFLKYEKLAQEHEVIYDDLQIKIEEYKRLKPAEENP